MKSQYALKALFELAFRNANHPVKISDIAGAQNIPPRFLEVILNQLKHAGLVRSRRGNMGGYVLGRQAAEITVGEIIEFMEGPIRIAGSQRSETDTSWSFVGDHAFAHLWGMVDRAVSAVCRDTSMAELVEYERARRTATAPDYAI